MTKRYRNFLMTLALCTAGPITAETGVDERIDALLASGAMPMAVAAGRIDGPGARFLIERGREASFFALGESHLNNETPALAAALLEALKPAGYAALAIETGPMIAEHAQALLSQDRGDELARTFVELPFSAAFIDHEPEFDLIGRAVELGYDLWGLDQVFAGGARFNLARLVELAPDAAAREAARAALEQARQGYRAFTETGDSSRGFLQSASEEDFERLQNAFRNTPEAKRIIDELAASSRIYQLFAQGANYRSNHERIGLMKRHLAEHLRAADPGVRVFMKFGAVHMQRGYSPLNQLDLGNAAAEIGVLRGGGSFHLAVAALRRDGPGGEVSQWSEQMPYLKRLGRHIPESSEWAVFDLRPLRPIFHDRKKVEGREDLAELVWGYDALALARSFTDASRLPGVPAPPGR